MAHSLQSVTTFSSPFKSAYTTCGCILLCSAPPTEPMNTFKNLYRSWCSNKADEATKQARHTHVHKLQVASLTQHISYSCYLAVSLNFFRFNNVCNLLVLCRNKFKRKLNTPGS